MPNKQEVFNELMELALHLIVFNDGKGKGPAWQGQVVNQIIQLKKDYEEAKDE